MKASTQLKAAAFALALPLSAQATVVKVQTVMGEFDVNLFDQQTPETVENFLGYVNSGAYFNNLVHRSVPEFIVQAGGFQVDDNTFQNVTTAAPVKNEPVLSNVRGTLAMAKKSGDANSATSQWFVNLSDNSANLDVQNGGFTVFGQVLGDGMDVVDAIAALPVFNMSNTGSAFTDVPLRDYTQEDVDNQVVVTEDNLTIITDIVVIDADTNTHPELNPKENTLFDQVDNGGDQDSGSSGGGSTGWLALMALGLAGLRRKWQK